MSSHRTGAPLASRWLLGWAAAGTLLVAALGAIGASANPAQGLTCTWQPLSTGERLSQHSLTYLPNSSSVASFGGGYLGGNPDRLDGGRGLCAVCDPVAAGLGQCRGRSECHRRGPPPGPGGRRGTVLARAAGG